MEILIEIVLFVLEGARNWGDEECIRVMKIHLPPLILPCWKTEKSLKIN